MSESVVPRDQARVVEEAAAKLDEVLPDEKSEIPGMALGGTVEVKQPGLHCPVCGLGACGHNLPYVED